MKKYCRIRRIKRCAAFVLLFLFAFFVFSLSVGAENTMSAIGEDEWEEFSQTIPPEAEEYFPQNSFDGAENFSSAVNEMTTPKYILGAIRNVS